MTAVAEIGPMGNSLPPGHRSGFVAIVGRPNAGKSTLINRILGRKIAIVTPKPQTTRRRLLGIKTLAGAQLLLVDTPGWHSPRDLLNVRMVERARQSVRDADVVLWVVDSTVGTVGVDEDVTRLLRDACAKPVAVLNKIDCISKESLLPLMRRVAEVLPGAEAVPVSALSGDNVDVLLRTVAAALPEGPRYYPADEITDESERSIVAEMVREQVILRTRQELPYSVAVTVDAFEEKPGRNLVVIRATIHVNRSSQKPIVVGRKGSRVKAIGQAARAEIEAFLRVRVFLELFVRVQEGWTEQVARLKEFGL